MIRKIAAGDIMTRNFAHTSPSTNVLHCARMMVKQKVGCLLITEHKKLLGLLTQKDILWAITKKPTIDLRTLRAIDIAARKVAVIKPSADISQAFYKMKKFGFRRLPVLSKNEVVGLLTIKDILTVEPSYYMKSTSLFDMREEAEKMQRLNQETSNEGFCAECGAFLDLLTVDGRSLCVDCREELY